MLHIAHASQILAYEPSEWSPDALRSIFQHIGNRTEGNQTKTTLERYHSISNKLSEGSIVLSLYKTTFLPIPSFNSPERPKYEKACKGHNTAAHSYLVWLIWCLAEMSGETSYESYPQISKIGCPGRLTKHNRAGVIIPDGFAPHLKWIVECGNFTAKRALQIIDLSYCTHFLVAPFTHLTYEWAERHQIINEKGNMLAPTKGKPLRDGTYSFYVFSKREH